MNRPTWNNHSWLRGTAGTLTLLVLGACTMAPHYQRPTLPVPADWPTGSTFAAPAETPATSPAPVAAAPAVGTAPSASALPWRGFYVAPELQQVIALALTNNRDLKVALLNVERFRAFHQIERAALLPQINGNAAGNIQQLPATLSGTGSQKVVRQYSVGLGVSAYEFDLFGRVRSLKDAALEEYLATEEARRAAQSSLIAAVADAYLSLAADRELLTLSRQTLESRKISFDLIRQRFDAGVSSNLDLQQAQTTVDSVRVQAARATRLLVQDENLLTQLVGASVPAELLPEALPEETTLLRELSPGLPSETLLARPDVIAAEHRLKGAHANIGAARAAFFPRIALTGSLGFGSNQLSSLFDAGAGAWSFVPQLTVPLFDAGRNWAGLQVSKVEREIAVAQYEQAIQTAFREVADALAERGTIDEQLAAQQSLTAAVTESYRLAEARYVSGIDSYLTSLDAQRSLFAAQQDLIATRLTQLTNRVSLYKVLGGGAE